MTNEEAQKLRGIFSDEEIVLPPSIEDWSKQYYNCLEDELNAINAAQDAKEAVEDRKQFLLAAGYSPGGGIDGKNPETRAAQEAGILGTDPTYQELKAAHKKAQQDMMLKKIKREAFAKYLDLIEAWFQRR